MIVFGPKKPWPINYIAFVFSPKLAGTCNLTFHLQCMVVYGVLLIMYSACVLIQDWNWKELNCLTMWEKSFWRSSQREHKLVGESLSSPCLPEWRTRFVCTCLYWLSYSMTSQFSAWLCNKTSSCPVHGEEITDISRAIMEDSCTHIPMYRIAVVYLDAG